MRTAALIVSAGKGQVREQEPLQKVGGLSAVQRLAQTFGQAGVGEIVLACREDSGLQRHMAHYGVVFSSLPGDASRQMLDYGKAGLGYLRDRCDQVLLTPVDHPLFSKDTVEALMKCGAPLANPVYRGRRGHPLLLSRKLIPPVLSYSGGGGLRGALQGLDCPRAGVEVADPGVVAHIRDREACGKLLQQDPLGTIRYDLRVRLLGQEAFFGPGAVQLLKLVDQTGSVRDACELMGISYSKAWKMIAAMERQLQCTVVERRQGGSCGGSAHVTGEGRRLLECYERFCKAVDSKAERCFRDCFSHWL